MLKTAAGFVVALLLSLPLANAQPASDPFAPLEDVLRAPSDVRAVTGRPGPGYWQQQADFDIAVTLDPASRSYAGRLVLTYTNKSPDTLDVIWFLLDQNRFEDPAVARYLQRIDRVSRRGGIDPDAGVTPKHLRRWQSQDDTTFGFRDIAVTDSRGRAVPFSVEGTLMRVDLAAPLRPGRKVDLNIAFGGNLVDADAFDARSGYEVLEDGTPIFGLAHWYPRPAAYTDYRGWHLEPFIEQGEMTTEFGDYSVSITVPDTYVVASTGTLANPRAVLTAAEISRLDEASKETVKPVTIITADEASARRSATASGTKTWTFNADQVRDFAFAASPAFQWNAMAVDQSAFGGKTVLAQTYWPSEGGAVWERFSTEAIAHTIEVFSAATFPYPYPQATAINGVINSGMEYPMISFNGPRPHPEDARDGIYTARDKYRVIGIVIHETGHFYLPMVVNSDERLWMWMDEGMTTFLEVRANLLWEPTFDESARRRGIIGYMTSKSDQPIMTPADSLISRGVNAYTKPTTALFVLRELVLGREAFDRAFAAYAQAWAFKRPTPDDFFRMMEQESGQDLDWFWRAWFYGTDHVDFAVEGVTVYDFGSPDADAMAEYRREQAERETLWRSFEARNAADGITYRTDRRPHLRDVYTDTDGFTPTEADRKDPADIVKGLAAADRAAYERALAEGLKLNVVEIGNLGGIPSPLPLVLTFEDGTTEQVTLPVHVWRLAPERASQLFPRAKAIVSVRIDPDNLTVDADLANNAWPRELVRKPIGFAKPSTSRPDSLMRDALKKEADGAAVAE